MCVMLLDISANAHYKLIIYYKFIIYFMIHCTGLGPAAAVCVPAVVSLVICSLLVGLMCGAGAGATVICVCIKWRRSRKKRQDHHPDRPHHLLHYMMT